MNTQFLIFTDLDGTLLDHDTYSHSAADSTISALKKARIPIIPTTSKTFAELSVLQEELALSGPFIVENGAAIHVPHGFFKKKPNNTQWQNNSWVRQFSSKKNYWLNLLSKIEPEFKGQFTHFSTMTNEQICAATGLTPEAAERAANRQYGEPVLWLGDELGKAKFIEVLKQKGARPLQGGRFIHVSGECDKGSALQWLVQEYKNQYPNLVCQSIALGDGGNDIAMLEAADFAIRILSPSHPPPTLTRQDGVITSTKLGPEGWSETLNNLLINYL